MSEEVEIQPLENIFDGEEAETIKAQPEIAEVAEVKEPAVETEETEVKAEEETTDTPTVSEDNADPEADLKKELAAFQAKAQDEKQKRQALEAKIRQQEVEVPDAYVEPEAAIKHAVSNLETKFQNKLLNMSENAARGRHGDDFDAMADMFFEELAASSPTLMAEAYSKDDPYEFVYQTAKNAKEMSQLIEAGGVEKFRSQIEKELRAKIEAEQADKTKDAAEKLIQDSIPLSLSSQRAAGSSKTPVFSGAKPLEEIVD